MTALREANTQVRADTQGFEVDDSEQFCPTHIFYIEDHTLLARKVAVLDMTSSIKKRHDNPTQTDIDRVNKLVKEGDLMKTMAPAYTVSRKTPFSKKNTVRDEHGNIVAHWNHPIVSTASAILTFPPDSKHCSHEISSKVVNWTRRTEQFIKDSVTYSWEYESKVLCNKLALYRIVGGRKHKVGQCQQPYVWTSGGVLELDSRGIDELVGLMTCMLVSTKNVQRHGEQHRLI